MYRKGILNQQSEVEIKCENRPINPRLNEIFDLVDSLADESDAYLPMHSYLTAQLCCIQAKSRNQ